MIDVISLSSLVVALKLNLASFPLLIVVGRTTLEIVIVLVIPPPPCGNSIVLIILSTVLTLIGGLIPSRKAAKQDPVRALRSE